MQDPTEEDNRDPIGGEGNFVADLSDDDATILDSLVSSEAEPPEADELPIVRIDMRPLAAKPIPAIKRMVTRTYNLTANVPMQVAFSNPWRESIRIDVNQSRVDEFVVYYGESREAVLSGLGSAIFYGSSSDLVLDYNGPLFVLTSLVAPAASVAVTEIITQETGR